MTDTNFHRSKHHRFLYFAQLFWQKLLEIFTLAVIVQGCVVAERIGSCLRDTASKPHCATTV